MPLIFEYTASLGYSPLSAYILLAMTPLATSTNSIL